MVSPYKGYFSILFQKNKNSNTFTFYIRKYPTFFFTFERLEGENTITKEIFFPPLGSHPEDVTMCCLIFLTNEHILN